MPLAYCLNILICLYQAISLIRPTNSRLCFFGNQPEQKTKKHKFEKKLYLFACPESKITHFHNGLSTELLNSSKFI